MPINKTLLIVYHSQTGATALLAKAIARGAAEEPSVTTRLLHAPAAGAEDVLAAAAYVFATPENLAGMSGLLKDFFDRCYYQVLDRINGRPYACAVCAGSDGSGAVRQIERIATGWRLRAMAPALIIGTSAQTPEAILAPKQLAAEALAKGEALGQALAGGLALGVF